MGSSYSIGSFNMLKLSSQPESEGRKDYSTIAKIIENEGFDVVALQEVFDEESIKNSLIPWLGKNRWEYCWKKPPSISEKAREGYAFLWKKNKLGLVKTEVNPYIEEKYRIKGLSIQGALIRPPFVIRLTPLGKLGGLGFELRLINTHIVSEKPSQVLDEKSKKELREAEFKVLSEQIYPRVATLPLGEENTSAYTFLLGDYNLVLSGSGYRIERLVEMDYRNPYRKKVLLTVQEEKTSLKRAVDTGLKDDEEIIADEEILEEELYTGGDIYSRNYDHFSYDADLINKMKITSSRVEAVGYCGNDLKQYRISISDHVPVKLEINLRAKE